MIGRLLFASLALCVVLNQSPSACRAQEAAASESAAAKEAPAADVDAKQAERNAALAKSLSNATLVGRFSASGRADGNLTPERYELGEVKHLKGEQWLIQARIKYGEHDLPIPLVLPIRWAGDTPVITVDEMAFPGMGTYTARVMIYRDHYAGFWAGKDHGGHLFGVIEHGKAAEKAAPAEPQR